MPLFEVPIRHALVAVPLARCAGPRAPQLPGGPSLVSEETALRRGPRRNIRCFDR